MAAAERVRRLRRSGGAVRRVADRLRRNAPSLVLAAAAAGISYLVAGLLFGADEAVFAPVAAVIATGLSAGQRRRRAVEITAGVVLGIAVADLLTRWLETGPWQVAVAVLLAMTVAVAFRASGLLSNQAAITATVTMALVPLLDSSPWVRLGDALVGGVVAIVLTGLLAPDPVREVTRAVEELLGRLAESLRGLHQALQERSLAGAQGVLTSMESLREPQQDLAAAMEATKERLRLGRPGTLAEQRRRLRIARQVMDRADLLLTSGRSLCRAGANLVRHGGPVEPALLKALDDLVAALEETRGWVQGDTDADAVRLRALTAAVIASSVHADPQAPSVSVLVGQLRSAVVDLLRISGLDQQRAVALLEEAAGRTDARGDGPAP